MKTASLRRFRLLSGSGPLLVNTDVHGNAEDFFRLREIFLDLLRADPDVQWVILGDIVHGPNDEARAAREDLYGYADESWAIAEAVMDLRADPRAADVVAGVRSRQGRGLTDSVWGAGALLRGDRERGRDPSRSARDL